MKNVTHITQFTQITISDNGITEKQITIYTILEAGFSPSMKNNQHRSYRKMHQLYSSLPIDQSNSITNYDSTVLENLQPEDYKLPHLLLIKMYLSRVLDQQKKIRLIYLMNFIYIFSILGYMYSYKSFYAFFPLWKIKIRFAQETTLIAEETQATWGNGEQHEALT
ncbi:uncharacterized protein LOC113353697 [Papaver somniferum]|uniref:uncharacterized protein LOC113353697 n=1 Tax=Papaver somniferum TaxID=3469 RepID=UPI000E6F4A3D|nr:uncharacterized protein LOC113353697 [Papaver somniferum]